MRWQAISADSHVVSGVWTFGVGVPAPPVENAYGAGGPTTTEHVVRWAWFLGLALTIGALGFRLIVLRGLAVPRALERRIAVAGGLGALATIHAGIVAFSLRAEDALQLPFGRFLYGDLSPMAKTRFGYGVRDDDADLRARRSRSSTSRGSSTASSRSCLRSRSQSCSREGSGSRATMPSIRDRHGRRRSRTGCTCRQRRLDRRARDDGLLLWTGAPDLRKAAFLRFSRLATALIASSSAPASTSRSSACPNVSDVWTTGYGRVLLVKIGLVSSRFSGVPSITSSSARPRTGRHRLPRADRAEPGRREHGGDGRPAAGGDPRRLAASDLNIRRGAVE